jgi:hypothetical protein
MLSYKIFRKFSTLGQGKYYNNAFDWADDKWNLAATIQTPQFLIDGKVVRLSKQSFLNLSICLKSEKYQKGRIPETYFVKMQDMIKLSVWKPNMPMLSFISTTKIVSFENQGINSKNVLVSFYVELQ